MLDNILATIRGFIPKPVYTFFQPSYHFTLSCLAAVFYNFPARNMKVILVTGTKGKSSTTEIIYEILKSAGKNVAVSNTINTRIYSQANSDELETTNDTKNKEEMIPNLYKMSTPGRFFIQSFLKKAFDRKCEYVILEVTSQAVLQYRHLFLYPSAFIFTNLSPEHIEAHGSFEKYRDAKVKIAEQLFLSKKENRILAVNKDDENHRAFLPKNIGTNINNLNQILYSKNEVNNLAIFEKGISFIYKNINFTSPLNGEFNFYNIFAALKVAESFNVDLEKIKQAIEKIQIIKGRVEFVRIENNTKQNFDVIVDYAHTKDSLQKLYGAFPGKKKICVLGGTGGGRDSWKRKEMGKIADQNCSEIILTDEDSYDEDLDNIISDIKQGIENKVEEKNLFIIKDRKMAIKKAINLAYPGSIVFITGKGTDPYIMGKNGSKIPWSDYKITKELLENKFR